MATTPLKPEPELTFADFQKMASDEQLSEFERIGFPNSYREGKEEQIFQDILRKLPNLDKKQQTVLDIGPGCSGPAFMLLAHCDAHQHQLILIDCPEMLARLPDSPSVRKVPGKYPDECKEIIEAYTDRVDAIICYSVLHYIFGETNLFQFLDSSLQLLAENGQMLIGDIPNISKRNRFFSSTTGVNYHREFMQTEDSPQVQFNSLIHGKIDDAVLIGLTMRARQSGFDAYLVPQPPDLPMANRREDMLIRRP